MDLILKIYSKERDENGKRKILKTYEQNSYSLLYGTVEDILKLFDGKSLQNDEEIINVVKGGKDQVDDLLKDIFYGLKDEEIRNAEIDEIALVLVEVLKGTILSIVTKAKNAMRG